MITLETMTALEVSDAELVAASLAGDREAFGEVVRRYQSLVCSLAYSATGCVSQSEDLAQETFVTAWKELGHLREPAKLRPWLCRIARNLICDFLRERRREPSHAAEQLEGARDEAGVGPLPSEAAISEEEAAILWRSLDRIPETYREPLVLFYREHRSVEAVAAALELSEDAVKQRLSRGRKLLHEEVLAFVEGALERTSPGKAFTMGVMAALPVLSGSVSAATLGAGSAGGGAAAKSAAAVGLVGAFLGTFVALFGTWVGYKASLADAETSSEVECVRSFYRKLGMCLLVFFVGFAGFSVWSSFYASSYPVVYKYVFMGLAFGYVVTLGALTVRGWKSFRSVGEKLALSRGGAERARARWEYRSRTEWLGLPLVHFRVGGGEAAQRKPVKAWIAAGDCAMGLIFAYGGMAIAPISVGGCALGLVTLGGCGVGVLALGGLSIGAWAFGGVAVGWQAFGGFALAWNGAMGGVALAHEFALGGVAQAAEANSDAAVGYFRGIPFFEYGAVALRYLFWINLAWVVPLLLWWRVVARRGR